MRKSFVVDSIEKLKNIYLQRNKLYGNGYKAVGKTMVALFPEGIELKTESDFNRFLSFIQMVYKLSREATQFKNGGHPDSLDDLAIYAMIQKELDGGK